MLKVNSGDHTRRRHQLHEAAWLDVFVIPCAVAQAQREDNQQHLQYNTIPCTHAATVTIHSRNIQCHDCEMFRDVVSSPYRLERCGDGPFRLIEAFRAGAPCMVSGAATSWSSWILNRGP